MSGFIATPTMQDVKRLEQQVHELRQAILAMAIALGAALPQTRPVIAALDTLAATPPPPHLT